MYPLDLLIRLSTLTGFVEEPAAPHVLEVIPTRTRSGTLVKYRVTVIHVDGDDMTPVSDSAWVHQDPAAGYWALAAAAMNAADAAGILRAP